MDGGEGGGRGQLIQACQGVMDFRIKNEGGGVVCVLLDLQGLEERRVRDKVDQQVI